MTDQFAELYLKHARAIEDLLSNSSDSALKDPQSLPEANLKNTSQDLFLNDFKNIDDEKKIAFVGFCLDKNKARNLNTNDSLVTRSSTQEELMQDLKKQFDEYQETPETQQRRVAGQHYEFNKIEDTINKEFDKADDLINKKYLQKIFKRIAKYHKLEALKYRSDETNETSFYDVTSPPNISKDSKEKPNALDKDESLNPNNPDQDSTILKNIPNGNVKGDIIDQGQPPLNQDQQSLTIQPNQQDQVSRELDPTIGLNDIEISISSPRSSYNSQLANDSANLSLANKSANLSFKNDPPKPDENFIHQSPISSTQELASYDQNQVTEAFKTLKLQAFNAGNPPRQRNPSTDILVGSINDPETLLNLRKKHISHLQDFWNKIQDHQPTLASAEQNSSFKNDLTEQFFSYAQNNYGTNLREQSSLAQPNETTAQKLANYQSSIANLLQEKTNPADSPANILAPQDSQFSNSSPLSKKSEVIVPSNTDSDGLKSDGLKLDAIALDLQPEVKINSSQQNPKSALASSVVSSQANIVTSQANEPAGKFSEKQNSEKQDLQIQYSEKPWQSDRSATTNPIKLDEISLSLKDSFENPKTSSTNSANNSSLPTRSRVDPKPNSSNSRDLDLDEIIISLREGAVNKTSTAQSSLTRDPASPITRKPNTR